MAGLFGRYWALMLLLAVTTILLALLFEISWPVDYIEVITVPSDAVISDSLDFQWTSPARIPVPDGGIELSLSREGWAQVDTLITTDQAGGVIVIEMSYLLQLEFETDPPAAMVLVDGDLLGHTPLVTTDIQPGTHSVILTTPCGISLEDSFTVISNEARTFSWVMPTVHSDRMLLVRAGSPGTVSPLPGGEGDTLGTYLIGLQEVTTSDILEWLTHLESYPIGASTWRWGRSELMEEFFPGDYPIAFYIAPWGQWAVMEGMEDLPVTGLSSRAAEEYCEWLSSQDESGIEYRLPTEREWETAALAGGEGPWPWGGRRPDGNLLNLSDDRESLLRRHPSIDDGFPQAAPVRSYPPNDWGLYDMAGNVWEWCAPSPRDSMNPTRGGGWLSSVDDCMCRSRMVPDSGLGYPYVGFRLAASLPE